MTAVDCSAAEPHSKLLSPNAANAALFSRTVTHTTTRCARLLRATSSEQNGLDILTPIVEASPMHRQIESVSADKLARDGGQNSWLADWLVEDGMAFDQYAPRA